MLLLIISQSLKYVSTTFQLGLIPVFQRFTAYREQLAVMELPLTDRGAKFFNKTSQGASATLQMHEFHQRYISTIPSGFTELAKNCQILLSDDNRILTFQGHPEMTSEMMSLLLLSPTSKESGYVNFEQDSDGSLRGKLMDRAAADHDGLDIMQSVVRWVSDR